MSSLLKLFSFLTRHARDLRFSRGLVGLVGGGHREAPASITQTSLPGFLRYLSLMASAIQ